MRVVCCQTKRYLICRCIDHATHDLSAIIGMGQSLHLRVIAEGVETIEDLSFLKRHRCDEAQGYYFSRPVPAADFARLLVPSVN